MVSKNLTPGDPVRLDLIKWLHVCGIVEKRGGNTRTKEACVTVSLNKSFYSENTALALLLWTHTHSHTRIHTAHLFIHYFAFKWRVNTPSFEPRVHCFCSVNPYTFTHKFITL